MIISNTNFLYVQFPATHESSPEKRFVKSRNNDTQNLCGKKRKKWRNYFCHVLIFHVLLFLYYYELFIPGFASNVKGKKIYFFK